MWHAHIKFVVKVCQKSSIYGIPQWTRLDDTIFVKQTCTKIIVKLVWNNCQTGPYQLSDLSKIIVTSKHIVGCQILPESSIYGIPQWTKLDNTIFVKQTCTKKLLSNLSETIVKLVHISHIQTYSWLSNFARKFHLWNSTVNKVGQHNICQTDMYEKIIVKLVWNNCQTGPHQSHPNI